MVRFRGISNLSLDAKGRIVLPARYRERLSENGAGQLVVTIDPDHPCLLIYPLAAWEDIEEKIENLPSFNPTTRRIQRLLIGHATEVDVDGSGRMLVAPPLREHADLDKKVVLVGQGKKFELWDEAIWIQNRDGWLGDAEDGEMPAALAELTL